MPTRSAAIVGSDTLLGQDIQQVLIEEAPHISVSLIGDEAESAILTERAGEPVVISTLDELSLTSAAVVFLTGTPESCERSFEIAAKAPSHPALIDLTHSLEDRPGSDLRAPLVDPPDLSSLAPGVHQIAHPAAIVIAEFLNQLAKTYTIKRSLAHVFGPASEYGREGIDELHKQTTNLLTFKQLPQDIFDMQLCFAMAPYLGPSASQSLASDEARLAKHLAILLSRSGGVKVPSIRLVQAPVFHGLSFSVWAEFSKKADTAGLMKALATRRIEIRAADEAPPTNIGVVGQLGMTVGRIEPDRANPRAAWFWIVADNHRVAAENAVRLARLLVPAEGRA
jgi:aspartate-semialdehyde dehydrogenase